MEDTPLTITRTATERGFGLLTFEDSYERKCSLQESSIAIYTQPGSSAVWLGQDEPEIIEGKPLCRMHLTRKQVTGQESGQRTAAKGVRDDRNAND